MADVANWMSRLRDHFEVYPIRVPVPSNPMLALASSRQDEWQWHSPFPPDLNERSGFSTVRPPSRAHLVSPNTSANSVRYLFAVLTRFPSLRLITLAAQNAALSTATHYSRIQRPTLHTYPPASTTLLNEILKGIIPFS